MPTDAYYLFLIAARFLLPDSGFCEEMSTAGGALGAVRVRVHVEVERRMPFEMERTGRWARGGDGDDEHMRPCLSEDDASVKKAVEEFINGNLSVLCAGPLDFSESGFLSAVVKNISIHIPDDDYKARAANNNTVPGIPEADELLPEQEFDVERSADEVNPVPLWDAELRVHVYTLNCDGSSLETLDGDDTDGDSSTPACTQWCLPAKEFNGLWESLILERGVKSRLVRYMDANMEFSRRQVDRTIISWNRVILLHGPPGTGKTTLCKALAQKLAIWHSRTFQAVHLLEINSHSLFSKWFSESGKMVARLFSFIHEMIEDESVFLFVLVDEVESLAAARGGSAGDPADAVRVVNALLTQLDSLKERSNVMVLTTSNITQAIDVAFVDRADLKQFIGLPPVVARYNILRSCLEELMRVGLISPPEQLSSFNAAPFSQTDSHDVHHAAAAAAAAAKASDMLRTIAAGTRGLSGRSLRKLPFLAHGNFICRADPSLLSFVAALSEAATSFREQRDRIEAENCK